jgi:REP element-mobilizing transposase RayT
MADKFQNKYRIPSARASWWNYGDAGLYFITICTANKEHWFGKIHDKHNELNELGKYVEIQIENIKLHYSYASIPVFVVMPNHIHLIVCIDADCMCGRDGARTVSTEMDSDNFKRWKHAVVNEKMQQISIQKKCLSVVVGGLKSAITKFAHQNQQNFAWQTRFHDHIIRNNDEFVRISHYICTNVERWDADVFNQ